MSSTYNRMKARLSQQAADEMIGYLDLLIDELQSKYCSEEVAKTIDCIDTKADDVVIDFDDNIPF
jgi:hypothetical protein